MLFRSTMRDPCDGLYALEVPRGADTDEVPAQGPKDLPPAHPGRLSSGRLVLLGVSAVSLYVFAPSIAEVNNNAASISEKYSAGPNSRARPVNGAPSAATSTVETQPAKNEPIAEIESAAPARPLRAIWWPSRQVTTDVASPGILTRIDVVEPPYCAP